MDEPYENGVRLVRGAKLVPEAGQTPGAQRFVAVSPDTTAATRSGRLWMGRVVNEPGMRSVPHHHGEAKTTGFVLSGHARIYWGERYELHIDMEAGDFCYVPPYLPHIEANASPTEPLVFLTCRTPDNIVVNLEDFTLEPD